MWAVVLFPILKRQHEGLALGYVTARLAESTFIAIGIVSLLAVVTLGHTAAGADAGPLVTSAKSLVAIRNWTFVLGPGFVVGVGNGLVLGYLMYQSRRVARGMAMLGLIGGPHLPFGNRRRDGRHRARLCGAEHRDDPGVVWELSLGIYLIVKGFKPSQITTDKTGVVVLGESSQPAIARPPERAVAVR